MSNPGPSSASTSNFQGLIGVKITEAQYAAPTPEILANTTAVYQRFDGSLWQSSGSFLNAFSSPSGDGTPTGATVTSVSSAVAKVAAEGTTLKTGSGLRLYQPDGTNAYMVTTSAYQAGSLACTVTWTAGNVVNVLVPAGHGCVESDAFVLQVATPGSNSDAIWAQVLRVAAVVDSANITVRLPFTPAAGPVSATTFQKCVRNINIDLDLDYNFAGNGAAGANPNRMALVLAFLADSTVRVRGKNAYKYIVLAAGCDNVYFDVGSFPNQRSDTFKLYGPANNCTVKVYGQAPEDCVSLQALEPAGFIGYMPCQGNIRNTRIRGISARVTTAGSAPVVVYADQTYNLSGTVIEDGDAFATAGTSDGLTIKAGTGFAPTLANMSDVTIRNMELSSAGGDSLSVRTPIQRLTLENVNVRAPGSLSQRGIYFNNDADVVEFNNLNWAVENWTPAVGNAFMRNVAAIKAIRFNSCRLAGKAATNLFRLFLMDGASSQCNLIEFNNCTISDMDLLCRFESTMAAAPTMAINGGTISNVLTISNFRKTGGKLILNGPTISGATNGLCRSEGASVITDIYGWANMTTPAQLAVSISGGKVNLKTPVASIDISATATALAMNPVAGNLWISSATLGAIPAGVPVTTRALTFTGALAAVASGTLASNFTEPSGSYPVVFSDGSYRLVALANGATTASWTGNVTATASAVYASAI